MRLKISPMSRRYHTNHENLVFRHLPIKFRKFRSEWKWGNFGSTDGKFSRNVLEGSPRFPTEISDWKMCLSFAISPPSGNYDQVELNIFRYIVFFFWLSGTWPISTVFTIRHFCLPFEQTVDEPDTQCKCKQPLYVRICF